jgi:hypothetical protein
MFKRQSFKFSHNVNPITELKQQAMTLNEVNIFVRHQPIVTITNAYKWIHNPPDDLPNNRHIYMCGDKFVVCVGNAKTHATKTHTYDEIREQLSNNFHTLMDNTLDFLKPTDARVYEMKHSVMTEQQAGDIEMAKKYHDSLEYDTIKDIVYKATPKKN